jgi:hypothetical protein
MRDVMITERATDGVIRCYRYRVCGGTLCRVNSAGNVVMRVCALPVGRDGLARLSDIQLAHLVVDWHAANCRYLGAELEWHFTN